MRILSWNVNGLRSVHNKGLFLEWLHEMSPDVLCLQETKAAEDQLPFDLRMVEGYEAHFAWPEHRRGYSGVALYTKEAPASVQRRLGVPELDMEGRMLVADYGAFVLLGVYFPNGRSKPERLDYKMRFYDAFLQVADGFVKAGQNLLVCGDVNTAHTEADIARPKENVKISGFLPEERAWMDDFLSHGYSDTLRMFDGTSGIYSYWDMKSRARERDVGWRIDYFFTSNSLKPRITNATVMRDVIGSDHCPITVDIDA